MGNDPHLALICARGDALIEGFENPTVPRWWDAWWRENRERLAA